MLDGVKVQGRKPQHFRPPYSLAFGEADYAESQMRKEIASAVGNNDSSHGPIEGREQPVGRPIQLISRISQLSGSYLGHTSLVVHHGEDFHSHPSALTADKRLCAVLDALDEIVELSSVAAKPY